MSVAERVAENLRLAEEDGLLDRSSYNERSRTALRWLFSILIDLEQIAVIAAERGGGIEGQLEDELVHRETFRALAAHFGGVEPTIEPVRELHDFLSELTGPTSLAVLNVVAEGWLAGVFERVESWGFAHRLFHAIGLEEQRHSADALKLAKPHPDEALPRVRLLERLLWQIAGDPRFHSPLAWLSDPLEAAQIGRDNVERHRRACEHLGVEPSALALEIGTCGLEVQELGAPEPIALTAWQRSAFRLEQGPISSHATVNVPAGEDGKRVELLAAVALMDLLHDEPRLNLTISVPRERLYRPGGPVVGLRRVREGELVYTVYLRRDRCWDAGGSALYLERAGKELRRNGVRARLAPYREVPDLRPIEGILPAPGCAVTITNVVGTGVERGLPSLNRWEGNTIAVAIGRLADGRTNLGVVVDHRAHNGRELGAVCAGLKERMEALANG